MRLRDEIPQIYHRLLPPEFLNIPTSESLATCADCRMCKWTKNPYSPHSKCCTFYPHVPNYLVGGILKQARTQEKDTSDETPNHEKDANHVYASEHEGARRIKDLIRRRQWILPVGVVAPPSYQIKFLEKHPEQFGRDLDFLCPFFEHRSKGCSIWAFRDSECSTYFCAYDEGENGRQKWADIGQRLFETQMAISQECMIQKGYTPAEVDENLKWTRLQQDDEPIRKNSPLRRLTYEIDAPQWLQFWQHHTDRIEDYFIECYEWVVQEAPNLKATLEPIFAKTTPCPE